MYVGTVWRWAGSCWYLTSCGCREKSEVADQAARKIPMQANPPFIGPSSWINNVKSLCSSECLGFHLAMLAFHCDTQNRGTLPSCKVVFCMFPTSDSSWQADPVVELYPLMMNVYLIQYKVGEMDICQVGKTKAL